MIISGGSRCGWKWFSTHFMRTDQGQQVSIAEVRGLAGDRVTDWFRQMEAISEGTRCDNFFYHANINPRDDEHLTPEEWEKAVDTLEHNLGLDGQVRFVIQHEKQGRIHRHVVWSRIDPDTMTAISDSKTYAIHMRTADELEKAFNHEPTPRGRGVEGRNPDNWEIFRGKESGINPYDVKAELTALYRQADTGQAFAAALEERGYILARGDRRDFVVIDQGGDDHSLARRIGGVKAAEIRARMADIDREALPSVDEARALARERAAGRDASARDASPLPAPDPAARRDDQGVGLVAETVIDAVRDPITEQRPPPAADVPEPSKDALTPKPEPPSGFDRLAHEMIAAAEKAAPALLAAAEVTLAAEERPQEAAKELTPFERIAEKLTQAMRAWGGEPSVAESLDWLARQITQPPDDPPPNNRELTPFERVEQDVKRGMRENAGEPEPGFWQRSVALLASARDRALEWIRESARTFVGRLFSNRHNDHDEPGRER